MRTFYLINSSNTVFLSRLKNQCYRRTPCTYSRVLNKHVGLNKHIGGKILENQIIVLVRINMLVGFRVLDSLIKVLVDINELVCKDF